MMIVMMMTMIMMMIKKYYEDDEDEETPLIASKRQVNKKRLIAKQQGAFSLGISGEVNYLEKGKREVQSCFERHHTIHTVYCTDLLRETSLPQN